MYQGKFVFTQIMEIVFRYEFNKCVARYQGNKKLIHYSNEVDKSTGLRCDQVVKLTNYKSQKDYPEKLRRIKYYDTEKAKTYIVSNE